jgi:nucleotide-binding universal stress UspA family protein
MALATATGIAQPAMTQLVGRLEREGLVIRLADPEDGTLVELSSNAICEERKVQMNRIVVGVDGSSAAMAGARWAAREAAMPTIELLVVHVAHADLTGWPQAAWPAIPVPAELGEGRLAQGERILADTLAVIAKTTGPRQPRSTTSRLCVGAVVPTLRDFCRDTAQMVVVGRRDRGGIHRGLLGSVGSALLHTANCPVAVVHDESTIEILNAPWCSEWMAHRSPNTPPRSPSTKPPAEVSTSLPCTLPTTPKPHRQNNYR